MRRTSPSGLRRRTMGCSCKVSLRASISTSISEKPMPRTLSVWRPNGIPRSTTRPSYRRARIWSSPPGQSGSAEQERQYCPERSPVQRLSGCSRLGARGRRLRRSPRERDLEFSSGPPCVGA